MNRSPKLPKTTSSTVDVIGYIRVSTAGQADSGAGLAAQRQAIEAECLHRGWNLVAIEEDAGIGGKKLTNRPALSNALDALARHEASALVVSKLDRLSRSMLDFVALVQRSEREGWKLLPLDLGVDLTTPAGEFMATVMAAMAQWERRIISARTKDSIAAKRAEGMRWGAPVMIGADVTSVIVERYRSGATLATIAGALNADGVPTSRGGRWYSSTLWTVLKREGVERARRGPRSLSRAA